MTLVDAGPLVALIDAGEPDHGACVDALGAISLPLVTTWPAFTEAMYLLARGGGWPAQQALWRLLGDGRLEIVELSTEVLRRSEKLMAKYADLPMDLADATLVAYAEEAGEGVVFTLDSDFQVYRLHGRKRFTLLPEV